MKLAPAGAVLLALSAWAGVARAEEILAITKKDGTVVLTNLAPTAGDSGRPQRRPRRPVGEPPGQRPYDQFIREVAARYGVDDELVHALISVESNYNPAAVSRKGAIGLMQLMPATARELGVRDPTNPWDNIVGGVRHLRRLLDNYDGDLTLSVAAYNAGAGAVDRHRGVPPFAETRDYVRRVRKKYNGPGRIAEPMSFSGAAIYRTVDAGGVVRYSQFPPPAGPPPDAVGWSR